MLFRQLFDAATSTYTYLLADDETRDAVLIDPVREQVERDIKLLKELELKLVHVLETHVHADHVTGAGLLRDRLGATTIVSAGAMIECADVAVTDGDVVRFGGHTLEVRTTPGHTDGDVVYVLADRSRVFTGDTVLIRGCGRSDFQQGDARALYRSAHEQVFSLPDNTLLYPGHDYRGHTVSTVGEEKKHNPRLGGGKTEEQFVALMAELKLPYPKNIAEALPANTQCGRAEEQSWAPIECSALGVPEVTASTVANLLDDPTVRLVDIRQPAEWTAVLGHIAGANLIPLGELGRKASGWDRAQPIVAVCRSGRRSGDATKLLKSMGFASVASLRGGMQAWNEAGLPARRDVDPGREETR